MKTKPGRSGYQQQHKHLVLAPDFISICIVLQARSATAGPAAISFASLNLSEHSQHTSTAKLGLITLESSICGLHIRGNVQLWPFGTQK